MFELVPVSVCQQVRLDPYLYFRVNCDFALRFSQNHAEGAQQLNLFLVIVGDIISICDLS